MGFQAEVDLLEDLEADKKVVKMVVATEVVMMVALSSENFQLFLD